MIRDSKERFPHNRPYILLISVYESPRRANKPAPAVVLVLLDGSAAWNSDVYPL
jgi:hypothetical protein